MKSTILIILYLGKDTFHRWLMRISSPLSRFFVVLFLSFCALVFLSSYIISIKVLGERIQSSGADLIVVTEFLSGSSSVHGAGDLAIGESPYEYERHVFHEPFLSAMIGEQFYPLVEYMPGSTSLFDCMEGINNGIFVLSKEPVVSTRAIDFQVDGNLIHAVTLPERAAGMLRRIYQGGAIFFPYGTLHGIWNTGFTRKYVLRVKCADEVHVGILEDTINQLIRLDKKSMGLVSSRSLLGELAQLRSSQYLFRVWVSIGISAIICLLLTSISSLEFRQNEYVYALMGSFGVSRMMLFGSFLVENTLLVSGGFAASLGCLWGVRRFISSDLYKSPGLTIEWWELSDDIRTFCLSFGICILVSCIPIACSIYRPIGRVLK